MATSLAIAGIVLFGPAPADASPSPFNGIARMTAPLLAHVDGSQSPQQQQQQEEDEPRRPPPLADPASGAVFSIMGGSVFSGSSSFQGGGAFAYYFGGKATVGFEVEGTLTFGPGGRVSQVLGSFMLQTGARTSKFVPYFAGGIGYVHASANLPEETRTILDDLGIHPEPRSESGPLVQFGGGVRFYIKPRLSFRADVRFAQVALDLEGKNFWDSLFPMRRIAGMVSWDF